MILSCDIPALYIGDDDVLVSNTAYNSGFIFDSEMSFVQQINSIVKSSSGEVRRFQWSENI